MSNATFRRGLNKMGYKHRTTRRKGKLINTDLQKRVKFSRKILKKNLLLQFWTEGIAMYLDGVGFEYKSNPFDHAKNLGAREWRLRKEGLAYQCTSKGAKEGKKYVKFMVGISHGAGVVLCQPLDRCISGQYFAEMIETNIADALRNSGKTSNRILQDGDPSQNSKMAKRAMDRANIKLFAIPPRSPDLNPIENLFNQIRTMIKKDSMKNVIMKESREQFTVRVKQLLLDYDINKINRLIESMPKRIQMVIDSKGQRTKY